VATFRIHITGHEMQPERSQAALVAAALDERRLVCETMPRLRAAVLREES